MLSYKSWNFRGDRIQWTFLGQTAASRCGFPTFRVLISSPSSGYADGLVASKLIVLGATKLPAHPDDGDGVSFTETSGNFHVLTLFSAREKFIEILALIYVRMEQRYCLPSLITLKCHILDKFLPWNFFRYIQIFIKIWGKKIIHVKWRCTKPWQYLRHRLS